MHRVPEQTYWASRRLPIDRPPVGPSCFRLDWPSRAPASYNMPRQQIVWLAVWALLLLLLLLSFSSLSFAPSPARLHALRCGSRGPYPAANDRWLASTGGHIIGLLAHHPPIRREHLSRRPADWARELIPIDEELGRQL